MEKVNQADLGFRWCQYVFDIYLGLLFSVYILFCAPYTGIVNLKHTLFLVICGGFALLICVSIAELLLLRQINLKELLCLFAKQKTLICLIIAYLFFTLLSAILSPYEYNSWIGFSRYEGVLTQIIYMAILLLSSIFGRVKKWHVYLFGMTTLFFSLLCLVQIMGYNPFGLYPGGYNYHDAYIAYSGEYIGTIGNSDLVSGFLSMIVIMFFTLVLMKPNKNWYVFLIPLIFDVVVLFLIGVAAGILSTVVTAFFLFPYVKWLKKSKNLKYILFIEGAIVLLSIVFVYCYDFGGKGTLYEFHEILHGRISQSFGSHRIMIWENVIREMPKHLWFGTGPDSMGLWELKGFTKYVEDLGYYIEQGIDIAHNEYLNVAAQQGVFSFISYISLIGFAIFTFFRKSEKKIKILFLAPIIAYLIQAFFGFSMCIVSPFFWTFLGILLNNEENKCGL